MHGVLLFGGSFDPIHHGHLLVARAAAERLELDRVVLIPNAAPPHKRSAALAEAADRFAMCELAAAGDPQFEVSDWEMRRTGPNFTLYTVEHFRTALGPNTAVHWLIGVDSLAELSTWHRARELVEQAAIVSVPRPGFSTPTLEMLCKDFSAEQARRLLAFAIDGPRIDISSTELRARVAAGLGLRFLTPDPVVSYIHARGLYRGGAGRK